MSHNLPVPWINGPDYFLIEIPSSPIQKPRLAPLYDGYCIICSDTKDDGDILDPILRAALDHNFILDVYINHQTLLRSFIQFKNLWTVESPFFKLYTRVDSIPCIPLESPKFFTRIDEAGGKVLAVTNRACLSTHNYIRVLKTAEHSLRGWELLYHELRQLLCMPPHPNVIPAPVALVYSTGGKALITDTVEGDIYNPQPRFLICGFLLHYFTGHTLETGLRVCDWPSHMELSCKCSKAAYARS